MTKDECVRCARMHLAVKDDLYGSKYRRITAVMVRFSSDDMIKHCYPKEYVVCEVEDENGETDVLSPARLNPMYPELFYKVMQAEDASVLAKK